MTTWTESPPGSGLMALDGYAPPGDVCPTAWERSFARADITTQVILEADAPSDVDPPGPVTRPTGTTEAQTLYGIEPYERRDLWTLSKSALAENADRILATRAPDVSMPRVRSVTLDATAGDASTRDQVVDLLSQLSVHAPSLYRGRFEDRGRIVFDDNYFAVGVTHDISAEAWTAEISLDRSAPYGVLDPIDYEWDVARWDHSLWN